MIESAPCLLHAGMLSVRGAPFVVAPEDLASAAGGDAQQDVEV